MEKFLNDNERFIHLVLQPEHRNTCLEFIRLGQPVSADMVAGLIAEAPDILDEILKMEFLIWSEWDSYNDILCDDSADIFRLCTQHFGSEKFFQIVSESPWLSKYFLNYFAVESPYQIQQCLSQRLTDNEIQKALEMLIYADTLQDIVRKKLDEEMKERLFENVRSSSVLSEAEILNCFGLDYCLRKGFFPLELLEYAYWELEDGYFWSKLCEVPETLEVIKSTKNRNILDSMRQHGLI